MTAPDRKRKFTRARATGGGGLRRAEIGEAALIEVRVRFPQRLITLIEEEAVGLGMPRYQWIAALVRRHLTGKPSLPRQEELALFQIHSELRRARTELMMIRRHLLESGQRTSDNDLLATIDTQATAEQAAMSAIRQALEGNLSYWEAPP